MLFTGPSLKGWQNRHPFSASLTARSLLAAPPITADQMPADFDATNQIKPEPQVNRLSYLLRRDMAKLIDCCNSEPCN
jgi:hypothetical protein